MRDEPLLAEIKFRIPGAEPMRPLLFHGAAHIAYYLTVDALRNFEQSDAVGPGPFVMPGVAFWFLATESYVSTIYKTCAEIEKVMSPAQSPAGYRLKDTTKIVEKLAAVKQWVAGDCPPGPPQSRLQEFATFRNALFHDLTDHSPKTQYAHTRFAPRAEKCNQIDLIEALRISLEVFAYFRFLFAAADLMPSVLIGLAFEKIDVLAAEVLEPAFAEVLAAKGFASAGPPPDRVPCPAELRIPLQFLLRAKEGPMAPRSTSGSPPFAVDKRQKKALKDRPVDDDKFQTPDYSRRY